MSDDMAKVLRNEYIAHNAAASRAASDLTGLLKDNPLADTAEDDVRSALRIALEYMHIDETSEAYRTLQRVMRMRVLNLEGTAMRWLTSEISDAVME